LSASSICLIPDISAVRFRNSRRDLARPHFVILEVKMEADSSFDAQTPLVENMVVGVPPVFEGLTKQIDKIVEQPLLGPKTRFPPGGTPYVIPGCVYCSDQLVAKFAFARKDVSGNRRPQAIAHRGYKAKFPENTMGAMKGAVEVGAEGLETDLHLTRDGGSR
jgi:tubulin gamma